MKTMKTKKMSLRKKIIIAEAIFVIGALIYLFFSTTPSQIYPLHGMTIIDPDFVFEIENGGEILISIDENFTDPLIFDEGSEFTLPPGTYFWKVKGGFKESEVRNFTIQGHVVLNIKEENQTYVIKNEGNVDLNVTKKTGSFISEIILEPEQSEEIENNSSYEGGQK